MKQRLSLLLHVAFALFILGTIVTPALADLPQQRKAIDEIQAAKKAVDPMPLLESAKTRLSKTNKGNKDGDRDDALKKLEGAISEWKADNRNKMEQKINANIQRGKGSSKRPQ